MYTNLSLYYLDQMGIKPWIKRHGSLSLIQKNSSSQNEAFKLLVFVSSNLSVKARLFLKKLMTYVNLDESEVAIIPVSEESASDYYRFKIEEQTPLAVLILGLNNNIKDSLSNSRSVLTSLAPDYLIAHPSKKRQIFQDINALNQLISKFS